jgi:hypothetical protein
VLGFRRSLRTLVISLTLVSLSANAATSAAYRDPNDVGHRLDLKTVELTFHRFTGEPYTLEIWIHTYDRWSLSYITGFGGGFIADFDSRGGPANDFYVRMRADSAGPFCEIHRRGGRFVGNGDAVKTPRGFYCDFPRIWLRPTHQLRWKIQAFGPYSLETDLAPDKGWHVGY